MVAVSEKKVEIRYSTSKKMISYLVRQHSLTKKKKDIIQKLS